MVGAAGGSHGPIAAVAILSSLPTDCIIFGHASSIIKLCSHLDLLRPHLREKIQRGFWYPQISFVLKLYKRNPILGYDEFFDADSCQKLFPERRQGRRKKDLHEGPSKTSANNLWESFGLPLILPWMAGSPILESDLEFHTPHAQDIHGGPPPSVG